MFKLLFLPIDPKMNTYMRGQQTNIATNTIEAKILIILCKWECMGAYKVLTQDWNQHYLIYQNKRTINYEG